MLARSWLAHPQFGVLPSLPVNRQDDFTRFLIHIGDDVGNQGSHKLLASHTELRLPRRRRGQCSTHTARELIEGVAILARISTDDVIAGVLNRNGHLTGRGNRWTRERIAFLRSHNRIPCYKPTALDQPDRCRRLPRYQPTNAAVGN